jgi:hypothetical protein
MTVESLTTLVATHSNGRETIWRRESDGVYFRTIESEEGGRVTVHAGAYYVTQARHFIQWTFLEDTR